MDIRLKVTEVAEQQRHWQDRQEKLRVYIDVQGENVWDNIVNRGSRPYGLYRKEVMPKVLEKLGLPADTKFRWSKHCGCSMCPCSPGFIVDVFKRTDVWATVTAADPENDKDAAALADDADHVERLKRAASLDADTTLPVTMTPEAKAAFAAQAFLGEVEDATS